MTVAANVGYGLMVRGVAAQGDRAARRRGARSGPARALWPTAIPAQLSGGQRQRVALARAIICEPRLILLDEPLAALDVELRKQMQLFLKDIQREIKTTFLFVTHDQEEAIAIADRICVMNFGRILQLGTPREVYYRPQRGVRRPLLRRQQSDRRQAGRRRRPAPPDRHAARAAALRRRRAARCRRGAGGQRAPSPSSGRNRDPPRLASATAGREQPRRPASSPMSASPGRRRSPLIDLEGSRGPGAGAASSWRAGSTAWRSRPASAVAIAWPADECRLVLA